MAPGSRARGPSVLHRAAASPGCRRSCRRPGAPTGPRSCVASWVVIPARDSRHLDGNYNSFSIATQHPATPAIYCNNAIVSRVASMIYVTPAAAWARRKHSVVSPPPAQSTFDATSPAEFVTVLPHAGGVVATYTRVHDAASIPGAALRRRNGEQCVPTRLGASNDRWGRDRGHRTPSERLVRAPGTGTETEPGGAAADGGEPGLLSGGTWHGERSAGSVIGGDPIHGRARGRGMSRGPAPRRGDQGPTRQGRYLSSQPAWHQ